VSALFWVNPAIDLGLTLITMSVAPVLAWFYHEPQLVVVAACFVIVYFLAALVLAVRSEVAPFRTLMGDPRPSN
jgi:Polysaccharide biosynthesis protein